MSYGLQPIQPYRPPTMQPAMPFIRPANFNAPTWNYPSPVVPYSYNYYSYPATYSYPTMPMMYYPQQAYSWPSTTYVMYVPYSQPMMQPPMMMPPANANLPEAANANMATASAPGNGLATTAEQGTRVPPVGGSSAASRETNRTSTNSLDSLEDDPLAEPEETQAARKRAAKAKAEQNRSEMAETAKETTAKVLERIKDGLVRTVKMTFLRPRGIIELISCFWIVGFVALAKHFIEGALHVDSLILPRTISITNVSGAKTYGRSLIGMLTGSPDKTAKKTASPEPRRRPAATTTRPRVMTLEDLLRSAREDRLETVHKRPASVFDLAAFR